jgi:hypothetical protein
MRQSRFVSSSVLIVTPNRSNGVPVSWLAADARGQRGVAAKHVHDRGDGIRVNIRAHKDMRSE